MITQLGDALGFPTEASEYLEECFSSIIANTEAREHFYAARDMIFCPAEGDDPDLHLKEIDRLTDIPSKTVRMVFLLFCTPCLRYIYAQKGLAESLFWETMQDLRYKLVETQNNYRLWGAHSWEWCIDFFRCKRFQLGRLQYERHVYHLDTPYKQYRQGDVVIGCHIPSSGPLKRDDVLASLKRAYAFYNGKAFPDGILPVFCVSWLLYEPHKDVFAKGSNLHAFYQMFDNIRNKADLKNSNFWRVFNTPYSPEALENAPEDTGLRRSFKAFLQAGNTMGNGCAMLLFDGERILTEKADDSVDLPY